MPLSYLGSFLKVLIVCTLFLLNIFSLSNLGTSCLIRSAFVSSRLISTTNSSAEAKSRILGIFPLFLFHFCIVLLFSQTKPYLEYLLLNHMYMPFPAEIMWALSKILLPHLYGYDTDCIRCFDPLLRCQRKRIITRLCFKPIEFDRFKIGIVNLFPQAKNEIVE